MSKRFRNAMVNFKSEEDLEIYLKKFSKEIPKLMPEIRKMTICRASKDSLLHFVTYDSEEEQNSATERFIKWRESITEEFQDAMALEGDIIVEWEN